MRSSPIVLRPTGLTSVAELLRPANENLMKGITVTPFVWLGEDGQALMEFEVRVTRIGQTRLPRKGTTFPA